MTTAEYKPLGQRVGGKKLDNYQTPASAINCLVPFMESRFFPGRPAIWEPAMGQGNLVRAFRNVAWQCNGTDILPPHSHDFLTWELDRCSYNMVVTNPPYALKDKFLARCYELEKPFALLLNITSLEGRKRQALYKQHGIEIILPKGRINYETEHGNSDKGAWFYSAWFTWGLNIGRQLTFAEE